MNLADWEGIRSAVSIDDAWTSWQSTFLSIVYRHIPHKAVPKLTPKNPHVTPEIERVIKQKRSAYRQFKKRPTPESRLLFATLRNKVTKLIRKKERAQASSLHREARLFQSSTTSKAFWHHVRQVTGRSQRSEIPDLVEPLSKRTISVARDKASLFNEFFVQQTRLGVPASEKADIESLETNPVSFTHLRTTPCEVFKILSTLQTNKAAGIDHIPASLLRFCARGIACSLTCLFNRSFELAQFPKSWKIALVVPIHKKGSLSDPGNYRPIALLPIVSKIIERLVHDKMSVFLTPWLSNKQSGFRKGDGTVPQLARITQEWSQLIDQSAYVGALFFDLKKAFDRVWHTGLIAKIEAAGIRGSALKWLKSFLSDRQQLTTVNGCTSSPAPVGAGVPQGAILSPLLFSVYLNDIVAAASGICEINLFADDTSAYVSSSSGSSLNEKLQYAADTVSRWFHRWHLSVNLMKTVSMAIRSKGMPHCPLSITIDNNTIPQVSNHRHLGITFSETLSWKEHVRLSITNASRKIGLLRRLRRTLTPTIIRDIYTHCVRPGIEYGSIIWSGLAMADNIRLERCNRSAARLIAGISPSMELPHNLILARASLQPLISRRKVTQNLFVRKALLRRHPRHLQELLASWIPTDDVNRKRHSLRTNRLTAQLPRPRKNCLKLSPFYGALTQWNKFVHRHNPQDLPSANFISKHFL